MTSKQQLDSFVAKYSPDVARKAFVWMRKKFPHATVLVYDNYNALAIGLSPRWTNLFFLRGAALPDPHKLLKGGRKQARSIRLDSVFARPPGPGRLIDAEAARLGLNPGAGNGKIAIKSISAKQRPRRSTTMK